MDLSNWASRGTAIGAAAGIVGGSFGGLIALPPTASAGISASNYQDFPMGDGDLVANYDVTCNTCGGGDVDWPVDLLYYGNATRPIVGSTIEVVTGWHDAGSNQYAYTVNAGGGTGHSADGGVKHQAGWPCADNTYHTRIYSDPTKDYNWNNQLGSYVWATAHADLHEAASGFEWLCSPTFGDNEDAEHFFASALDSGTGWGVSYNAFAMNNSNNNFVGNHQFYNTGYATKIHVN